MPLIQVQPLLVQVEMPTNFLSRLDILLLGRLVVVRKEDLCVPGLKNRSKILCLIYYIYYILCCVHDLLPVVLHAGLPANTEVPSERVQTVLFRAIWGSTVSSMVPTIVTYFLNDFGLINISSSKSHCSVGCLLISTFQYRKGNKVSQGFS